MEQSQILGLNPEKLDPLKVEFEEDISVELKFDKPPILSILFYCDGDLFMIRTYFTNFKIETEQRLKNNQLHHEEGPAYQEFGVNNDMVHAQEYWLYGEQVEASDLPIEEINPNKLQTIDFDLEAISNL